MERIVASSSSRAGALLSTHRVLRNTYFLLALTLGVSAITATASTLLRLPSPGYAADAGRFLRFDVPDLPHG